MGLHNFGGPYRSRSVDRRLECRPNRLDRFPMAFSMMPPIRLLQYKQNHATHGRTIH